MWKLVVSCNNQEEPWAIKWDHPWCPDNLNLSVGTLSLEMQFLVWGSPRPSWPPPSFPYYISTTTNSNFKRRHMLHTYAQNYFPGLIKFCMNGMIMTTMMITMIIMKIIKNRFERMSRRAPLRLDCSLREVPPQNCNQQVLMMMISRMVASMVMIKMMNMIPIII